MNSGQNFRGETLETDVVVVGGGGAGLAAAVSAAEKGAKVILLEKQGIGGNSAIAKGILAADSLVQKSRNITATVDEVVRIALEYSHWAIDQRILRAFVNKSADTIQWLEDMGLGFEVPHVYPGQNPRTWHVPAGQGAAMVKALRTRCEELGVQMLIRCPVKKILTGETGEVTGVLAARDDKELRVFAKSVIVATGGYGGNRELLKKYHPSYSDYLQNCGLDLMGDGILMGMEIGAATEGLGSLMLHPHVYPGSKFHGGYSKFVVIAQDPRGLWVNLKGERFTDEGIGLIPPELGNVLNRQPDKCVVVLWDEELKDIIKREGSGKHPVLGWRDSGGRVLTDLDKDLRSEAENGGISMSHSWDEIARYIGVAPESLNATVEKYNNDCDRGRDSFLGKEWKYLRALRTPPFYAIKCYLSYLTTLGGVKINDQMKVLNKQEEPIAGLYAGGDITGGWEAETYCMVLAGSAFGFAINSGRIAGENAAEYAARR